MGQNAASPVGLRCIRSYITPAARFIGSTADRQADPFQQTLLTAGAGRTGQCQGNLSAFMPQDIQLRLYKAGTKADERCRSLKMQKVFG